MTVMEVANYFGISKAQVYAMLRRETKAGFPAFKVEREWRIDFEQMLDWICKQIEN
jgi:excisionase family DNA binding protein